MAKCGGIEPFRWAVRAWAEDRLAGIVGANRIFAQNRACIGGIAEHRDGEGHAGLNLINGAQLPVLRDQPRP